MADLTGEALARELGRLFSENQSLRLSKNGILALLGNAGHESQHFTRAVQNPRVAGGNPGPGRGLFQWDNRRQDLDRWMAQNGYFPGDYMNPAVNAGFAAHELLGAEGRNKTYIIPGFGSMTLLEALRNPNISAAELSDVVHRVYERPADVGNETFTSAPARQAWAQRAGDIYDREGGWGSAYSSGTFYGDPNVAPRADAPPKDPLRPAIFDDINTMLPDIPGTPGDLPDTPGIDGPPTLERLAGFYSSDPSTFGSRYDVTPVLAQDPYRAPTPPPPNLPGWENRAANEAAGRVASAQTLSDWRSTQADRAARGLVWNGRDWVEGGTWTGREYIAPLQEARGGANTGIGLTMNDSGAYVPNVGGVGGDQRFLNTGGAPSAAELNGFQWTPPPVPDVSVIPSGPLLAPQPVAAPPVDPYSTVGPMNYIGLTPSPGIGAGGPATTSSSGGPPGVAPVNPFYVDPNAMPGVGGGSGDLMTITVNRGMPPGTWE